MLKKWWATTPWQKAKEARRLAKEAQDKRFERAFWNVFCNVYEARFREHYCGTLLYFKAAEQSFQGAWFLTFSESVRRARRIVADGRTCFELEDMIRRQALDVAAKLSMIIMLEVAINQLTAKEANKS
jgi:hypothetical protein